MRTATGNSLSRLLDRDDPGYSAPPKGRVLGLSYVSSTGHSRAADGRPTYSKALPRDVSTLKATAPVDLVVSWREHYPKTGRAVRLNIDTRGTLYEQREHLNAGFGTFRTDRCDV